jgi:hypothetical protein
MNKNSTVATAAASGGFSGAAVVVLTWALGVMHVEVPPEVAAAAMVLLSPIVHLLAMRLGVEAPAAVVEKPTVTPTP